MTSSHLSNVKEDIYHLRQEKMRALYAVFPSPSAVTLDTCEDGGTTMERP